jgi:hypothetical protein
MQIWYARTSATKRLPNIRIKRFSGIGSLDQAAPQLCADVSVRQRQYPSFSDDHDVLRGWKPGFVQSEKLAQKALDPVSLYGVPCFFADRHAQPSDSRPVQACDDREMRRGSPYPLIINPQIVLAFPNALISAKGLGFHVVPPLSGGLTDLPLARPPGLYRQSLPTLRPSSAEDIPAASGGHPDEEAMGALSLCVAEHRQCLFHNLKPRLKLIAGM